MALCDRHNNRRGSSYLGGIFDVQSASRELTTKGTSSNLSGDDEHIGVSAKAMGHLPVS